RAERTGPGRSLRASRARTAAVALPGVAPLSAVHVESHVETMYTAEDEEVDAVEFPPVGQVHPEGVSLDAELLDEIRTRVTGATDGRIADAVVRFLENTASTTVRRRGPDDTFVMTGDIPAMWLRDSSAQVGPLLRVADR